MAADGGEGAHVPVTVYQREENDTPMIYPSSAFPMETSQQLSEPVREKQVIIITPDTSQSPNNSDDSVTRDGGEQVYAYLTDDGQGNFTLVNEHSYNKAPGNSSGESDSLLATDSIPIYLISEDGKTTHLVNSASMDVSDDASCDGQNVVVVEVHRPKESEDTGFTLSNYGDVSQRSSTEQQTDRSAFSTTVDQCLKRKQDSKTPKQIVRLCNLSKTAVKSAPAIITTQISHETASPITVLPSVHSDDSNSQFSVSEYENNVTEDSGIESFRYQPCTSSQSFIDTSDYKIVQSGRDFIFHRYPNSKVTTLEASSKNLSTFNVPVSGAEPMDIAEAKRSPQKFRITLNNSHTQNLSFIDQSPFTSVKSIGSRGPLCTSTPLCANDGVTSTQTNPSVLALLTTPTSTKSTLPSKISSGERLVGEPAVAVARRILEATSDHVEAIKPGVLPEAMSTVITPTNKDFDPGPTDDSLTNIQWLGKMSGHNLSLKEQAKKPKSVPHHVRPLPSVAQVLANEQRIEEMNQECGGKKRPNISYMHLIQMAISSKPDKKMALKEIYKWIEVKFPYYLRAPPGWKNSIRHNLSLYPMFVRGKTYREGSGTSYWTLQDDHPNMISKCVRPAVRDSRQDKQEAGPAYLQLVGGAPGSVPQILQVASSSTSSTQAPKPRKGPTPLLPKLPPPTLQTFAFIPLPTNLPVVTPQPVVMSSWPATQQSTTIQTFTTASTHSFIGLNPNNAVNTSATTAGVKRPRTDRTESEPCKKHVRIAPKANILDKSHSRRRRNSSSVSYSGDTSDIRRQLSKMNFDSGLASDLSNCESPKLGGEHMNHDSPLPDPPKPTRLKRSRKDKPVLLRDFDEEISIVSVEERKKRTKEQKENIHKSTLHVNIQKSVKNSPKDIKKSPEKTEIKEELQDTCSDIKDLGNPLREQFESGGVGSMHISLNESGFSGSGFHDLLALIDADLHSPNKKESMQTPPTPSVKPESPNNGLGVTLSQWMSPIRCTPSKTGSNTRPVDGFLTPDRELATSTPNNRRNRSPLQPASLNMKSPGLGSLRDLGLPGLTPLRKSRQRLMTNPTEEEEEGVHNSSGISNRSFQKLLNDFQLESVIDQVDNGFDIANFDIFQ